MVLQHLANQKNAADCKQIAIVPVAVLKHPPRGVENGCSPMEGTTGTLRKASGNNIKKSTFLQHRNIQNSYVFYTIVELLGSQNSSSKTNFWTSTKTLCSEMPQNGIVKIRLVFIQFSPQGFTNNALENNEKTCLRSCRSSSLQKRSKIEHVNISLYREQFHLPTS